MPYAYFVLTMQAFKDGTRSNDAGAVVRQFVGQINDDEVKSLAAYYLALGRRQRAPLE
jgi:cytochrome c553